MQQVHFTQILSYHENFCDKYQIFKKTTLNFNILLGSFAFNSLNDKNFEILIKNVDVFKINFMKHRMYHKILGNFCNKLRNFHQYFVNYIKITVILNKFTQILHKNI